VSPDGGVAIIYLDAKSSDIEWNTELFLDFFRGES
jgi:hypothetical protein